MTIFGKKTNSNRFHIRLLMSQYFLSMINLYFHKFASMGATQVDLNDQINSFSMYKSKDQIENSYYNCMRNTCRPA